MQVATVELADDGDLFDDGNFVSLLLAGAPDEDDAPQLLPCDVEPPRPPLKPFLPERVRLAVMWRDRWTCQLCGEPIDRSLRWPDSRSGSVDHVLPKANGGDHAYSNLRASHLACNQRRGRRG